MNIFKIIEGEKLFTWNFTGSHISDCLHINDLAFFFTEAATFCPVLQSNVELGGVCGVQMLVRFLSHNVGMLRCLLWIILSKDMDTSTSLMSSESVLSIQNNSVFFSDEYRQSTAVAKCSSLLFPNCAVKPPVSIPNAHSREKVNVYVGF